MHNKTTWKSIALLAVGLCACGSDSSSSIVGPGDACGDETACEAGLVCSADDEGDAVCQRPAGSACDPEAEVEDNCLSGTECEERVEIFEHDIRLHQQRPSPRCGARP